MQIITNHFCLFLLAFYFILCSCNETPNPTSESPDLNVEEITKGDFYYSKGGVLKARIQGDTIFRNVVSGILTYTDGIVIDLYDTSQVITANLTADSAIYDEVLNESRFYKNVIVIDLKKKDTMWAEDLIIKFSKDSIFTNTPVHIKTATENIFGSSFYSNLNFTNSVVRNSSGVIVVPNNFDPN